MSHYRAPLDTIYFTLFDVLDSGQLVNTDKYQEATEEIWRAVLEEGARFTEEVLLPLNGTGDRDGCHYDSSDYTVSTPAGFREAYASYREGGWSGMGASAEIGGQGLPHTLCTVMNELVCSTNLAFGMYPGLSHGAMEALSVHAAEAIKDQFLPQLVTGEWTGTMCLTEPQCGTDLGLIRCKAQPCDDDSYAISGTKIWITGGEHDLVENIIHLVLARLPDAPEGSRGLSLFVVPKLLPSGERNGANCGGIEHKMGINGSATCVMNFDGAKGWLVGEANRGLNCMFTMMNAARLMVGVQGLGIAETAYQVSRQFCLERRQGRALAGTQEPDHAADPIIVHPDVRRMLLRQKCLTESCRAMAYWTALQIDLASAAEDELERQQADDIAQLMTPVVKAFLTDEGFAVADLALQTLGGAGYTQDWPVEQLLRDVRITRIYEGTNGVQAMDLVGRKLTMRGGRLLSSYFSGLEKLLADIAPDKRQQCEPFLQTLQGALDWLIENAAENPEQAGAAASPLLRLFALTTLAVMSARMAHKAEQEDTQERYGGQFSESIVKTSDFYFSHYSHEAKALYGQLAAGKSALMAPGQDQF